MKSLFFLLFPLILSKVELGDMPSFSSKISFPKLNGVVHLTEDTFEEALRTYDNLLIKFYAEWCGHCKALAPEYIEAAKSEKLQKTGLVLAEINVDFYRKVAKQFDINGFPQLFYFKKGKKVSSYNGGRKKDDFIGWAKKNLGSPYELIKDEKDINEMFVKDSEKPGLLYFGNNAANLKVLGEYSLNNLGRKIGVCKNNNLAKERKLESESIQFFQSFGKKKVVDISKPKLSIQSLDDMFYEYGNPHIVEDAAFISEAVFHMRKPVMVVLTGKKDDKLAEQLRKADTKKFEQSVKICILPIADEFARRLADYFHIQPKENDPAIFILSNEKTLLLHKFSEEKKTLRDVQTFAKKFIDGKVPPEIKSEEIPTKQDKPVYKLVAKNFEQEVIKSDINYMVKFYRPTCPHCVRLAPEFEKAAKELKDDKRVRLAEFDVSANDNNFVDISGVPSVFMYVNGEKDKPIPYEGARTAEAIKEFVLKNIK